MKAEVSAPAGGTGKGGKGCAGYPDRILRRLVRHGEDHVFGKADPGAESAGGAVVRHEARRPRIPGRPGGEGQLAHDPRRRGRDHRDEREARRRV